MCPGSSMYEVATFEIANMYNIDVYELKEELEKQYEGYRRA
jgi:hypothetical protein